MTKIAHCVRCGDRDLASPDIDGGWCWTCEEDYFDYVEGGGTLQPHRGHDTYSDCNSRCICCARIDLLY